MEHKKKIERHFYSKICSNEKLWEIRKEDDQVYSEFDTITFTTLWGVPLEGRWMILYVLRDFPGIEPGYCIFTLSRLS